MNSEHARGTAVNILVTNFSWCEALLHCLGLSGSPILISSTHVDHIITPPPTIPSVHIGTQHTCKIREIFTRNRIQLTVLSSNSRHTTARKRENCDSKLIKKAIKARTKNPHDGQSSFNSAQSSNSLQPTETKRGNCDKNLSRKKFKLEGKILTSNDVAQVRHIVHVGQGACDHDIALAGKGCPHRARLPHGMEAIRVAHRFPTTSERLWRRRSWKHCNTEQRTHADTVDRVYRVRVLGLGFPRPSSRSQRSHVLFRSPISVFLKVILFSSRKILIMLMMLKP